MKLFKLMRIVAQLIDLIVGMLVFAGAFILIPPFVLRFTGVQAAAALLTLAVAAAVCFALQLPFMQNRQTIGKAFCGMRIESTDGRFPVTVGLILHRELLLKLATCYIICIPLLYGETGGHEEATHTKVVRSSRRVRK